MSTRRSKSSQSALTAFVPSYPEWLHRRASYDRWAAAYVRENEPSDLAEWLTEYETLPVVRATDSTAGKLHLADLSGEEAVPACKYSNKGTNWRGEPLRRIRAWRDHCTNCFPNGLPPKIEEAESND